MDVVGPGPLDAPQSLTDDVDFTAAHILLAELAGDALLEVADLIDDVQRLLGEANADGPPVVRRTLMP